MSEEPDDKPKPLSWSDPDAIGIQDPLFAPPRSEMPDLTDDEYNDLKNRLGSVGTEHDATYSNGMDRDTLMEQLGLTASGRTVPVRLFPETMTRGDIDVRNTTTWSELSRIHYLHHELNRARVASPLDTMLFKILDPIMQNGVTHPNAIGLAFIGKPKSKGRPERLAIFGEAMQLVQHGTAEQREATIKDMERRIALAQGQPDAIAVEIAKQLVLKGMPLGQGEKYGDEDQS